jgi:hypothetical protein
MRSSAPANSAGMILIALYFSGGTLDRGFVFRFLRARSDHISVGSRETLLKISHFHALGGFPRNFTTTE